VGPRPLEQGTSFGGPPRHLDSEKPNFRFFAPKGGLPFQWQGREQAARAGYPCVQLLNLRDRKRECHQRLPRSIFKFREKTGHVARILALTRLWSKKYFDDETPRGRRTLRTHIHGGILRGKARKVKVDFERVSKGRARPGWRASSAAGGRWSRHYEIAPLRKHSKKNVAADSA